MSDDPKTVAEALLWATAQLQPTSSTPRLDAELLLAHALCQNRAHVVAESRLVLSEAVNARFQRLIARRAALEPVAYITGHKAFYGLDLIVDRRVLVPRPETELLVDLTLQYVPRRTAPPEQQSSPLRIAEVGTGSGCIAVALALFLPAAQITAIDISADALEVAQRNITRHGVTERVRLIQGDLLAPLDEPVDMLISNPPYTILSEIDEGVRRHEPHVALDGGHDGLEIYRRLFTQAPAKLRAGGVMLIEIGATQGESLAALAHAHFPKARIDIRQDLAGRDRVLLMR